MANTNEVVKECVHKFTMDDKTSSIVKCAKCGECWDVAEADAYARGFKAAGGDPNEVFEGFE